MPKSEDRALESLVRGSKDLLMQLGDIGGDAATDAASAKRIAADMQAQDLKALATAEERSTDGECLLSVSADEMLLHASFHPPSGHGKPVSLEDVEGAIAGKGITVGVDGEAVKGCILTCNEEKIAVAEVVVARGKRPVPEVPPYLVIADTLREGPDKPQATGSRVDFRELSLFTLVKKGDTLATLIPKQDGAMGTTVRGVAVAFDVQRHPSPRHGKNTVLQSGNVIATVAGRFQSTPDSIWVDEMLQVGDVDLRVGNIDFPGDVVIRGEVRDGFAVKVGKSLLCVGSIGAARIDCAGDLATWQGIIGREKASLRVGGATEAKFLEACSLDSTGPVRVKTSILNCTVQTADRVEMGEKGIITGGVLRAANGVSAAQIGSDRGPRTEIHCGIDFAVEQRLIWIRDRTIALAFKLKEIDAKMRTSPSTRPVLAPLRDKVKAAIHTLNESSRTIVSTLDRNEEADVSVQGTVFPGTYIEICHVSHFITRPVRFVTFRLDKASGKITERKWEPQKARPPAAALP